MNKRKLTIAAMLALGTSLFGSSAAPAPILLGGAFNLTGGQASLDGPAYSGAKLAVKEINSKGGVLGRPLKLILEDTKTDLKLIPAAAERLIGRDKVTAVLGYSDTDPVLTFAPTSEAAKVPFVVVGGTAPQLRSAGARVFLEAFGDNTQAAVGAELLLTKLNVKSVYLLRDTTNTYTTGLAKYFKDAFVKGGGVVALEDTYKGGDKTFSAQMAKLKGLNPAPDALYVSAQPDDVANVVRALREAGFKQPLVGGDGYDTPDLLAKGGESAENVYYTTHILLDATNGNSRAKAFIKKYRAEYGKDPENAFAALGYDAVRLIVNAMLRAGSSEKLNLYTALTQTREYGQITGSVSFSPLERIPKKAVTVVGVKGGQLTLVGEFTPGYVPAP